jgi:hypothetical protein
VFIAHRSTKDGKCLKGQKETKNDVTVLRILKIYKSDAGSVRFGVFTALM